MHNEGAEGRRVTYRQGPRPSKGQADAMQKSISNLFANPDKVPEFAKNQMRHAVPTADEKKRAQERLAKKKEPMSATEKRMRRQGYTKEGTNLSFSQWLEAYGGSYGSVRAGNPGGKSSTTYKGSKDYTKLKGDPKKKPDRFSRAKTFENRRAIQYNSTKRNLNR